MNSFSTLLYFNGCLLDRRSTSRQRHPFFNVFRFLRRFKFCQVSPSRFEPCVPQPHLAKRGETNAVFKIAFFGQRFVTENVCMKSKHCNFTYAKYTLFWAIRISNLPCFLYQHNYCNSRLEPCQQFERRFESCWHRFKFFHKI